MILPFLSLCIKDFEKSRLSPLFLDCNIGETVVHGWVRQPVAALSDECADTEVIAA